MEGVTGKRKATLVPSGARSIKIGNCIIGHVHDRKRTGRTWALAAQRLAEIEELIRSRHGAFVDSDDGESYLPHLAAAAVNARRAALSKSDAPKKDDAARAAMLACRRWLPKIDPIAVQDAAEEAAQEPRYEKADELGAALRVTFAERAALGLKTIGCFELTKKQRRLAAREVKRERDRKRNHEKRRKEGRQTAAARVEGSVAQLARAHGVSRKTIYSWIKHGKIGRPEPTEGNSGVAHIMSPIRDASVTLQVGLKGRPLKGRTADTNCQRGRQIPAEGFETLVRRLAPRKSEFAPGLLARAAKQLRLAGASARADGPLRASLADRSIER
ncbi:hypothetical protein HFO09_14095 [Rhizobium laguerreae]|uniref:hypothetical protein n=1 Tax=Rhizobium laguerreae TaxID=1076926 RepID=UPI001C926865|nr:hypothetical protein [Rhizobium laguerreae]MBY3254539.1 hypothetical protein [Rhizobium laguerreae]MBY3283856.1 hypothetical protein [Rhizobium laguerreae]MBY3290198.1 hypothetical protein [Rhizobium laguerreae]